MNPEAYKKDNTKKEFNNVNPEVKEHIENFEDIKTEFRTFTQDYFDTLLSGSLDGDNKYFSNPIERKMKTLLGSGPEDHLVTKEVSDLTHEFVLLLRDKLEEIFYSQEIEISKKDDFIQFVKENFFGRSPNILAPLLSYDVNNYFLALGEMNNSGCMDNLVYHTTGEVVYNISFEYENSLSDSIKHYVQSLSDEKKIIFLKTIARITLDAQSVGYESAHHAYLKGIEIIHCIKEEFNLPLLNLLADYNLHLIEDLEKQEETGEVSEFLHSHYDNITTNNNEHLENATRYYVENLNSPFYRSAGIQQVSKDYFSLSNGLQSSFGLFVSQDYRTQNNNVFFEGVNAEVYDHTYQDLLSFLQESKGLGKNVDELNETDFSFFLRDRLDYCDWNIKNQSPEIAQQFQKKKKELLSLDYFVMKKYLHEKLKNRITVHPAPYNEVIKNKDAGLISSMHTPEVRWIIKHEFGVDVREMYLDEQVQFLDYLAGTKQNEWNTLETILKNEDLNSNNILRAFLSLDIGGSEMSQKILDLAEKLPSESANAIFTKYSELVDATKGIEAFITSEFSHEIADDPEIIDRVCDNILQKGVSVLNIFYNRIDALKETDTLDTVHLIENELSKISADAIATLSTFKFARKLGFDLTLEDIKGSEFQHKNIADISIPEQMEMLEIYTENNKQYDPQTRHILINQFTTAFQSKTNSEFYTYRINNELNAFIRFESNPDGSKFASALNVAKESQGYALGEAMIAQALTKEAHEHVLHAEANMSGSACSRYLDMGFVAVSAAKYEGVHALNLVWDNQANTSYLSRSFTREGIRSGEYSTAKGIDILVLDNPRDFDRSQLEHGVMTHSFTDNTTGKHYVVLEHKRELNPDEKQAE